MTPRIALPRLLSRRLASHCGIPRTQRLPPALHHIPISISSRRTYSTPMAAPSDTAAADTAAENQITPESLTATLKSKLSATHVSIHDMSGGCGQAFNAIIVSPEFEKKTLLARHRLVNNALKQEIAAIHAWTPRCLTPEQWEKEKASAES